MLGELDLWSEPLVRVLAIDRGVDVLPLGRTHVPEYGRDVSPTGQGVPKFGSEHEPRLRHEPARGCLLHSLADHLAD